MKTLAEELRTPVHTAWLVHADGTKRQYSFHLGTDEAVARIRVEELARYSYGGSKKVELRLGDEIVDTRVGEEWLSEFDVLDFADLSPDEAAMAERYGFLPEGPDS